MIGAVARSTIEFGPYRLETRPDRLCQGSEEIALRPKSLSVLAYLAQHPGRLDPYFTTASEGLGLGLTISRSIVDRHGGRLWATSNGDHGSTFHLALPAGQPPRDRTKVL